MKVGGEYVVEYGSTQQRASSRGLKPRRITVVSHGDSTEMSYYRLGMKINKGVWVLDHDDADTRKLFFYHRFWQIELDTSIDHII